MILLVAFVQTLFAGTLDYHTCQLESVRKDHVQYSSETRAVSPYASKPTDVFTNQKAYFAVYGEGRSNSEFGDMHIMNFEMQIANGELVVKPDQTLNFVSRLNGLTYTFENFAVVGVLRCEAKTAAAVFKNQTGYISFLPSIPKMYKAGEYTSESCFVGDASAARDMLSAAIKRANLVEVASDVEANAIRFDLKAQTCGEDIPFSRDGGCYYVTIDTKLVVNRCR